MAGAVSMSTAPGFTYEQRKLAKAIARRAMRQVFAPIDLFPSQREIIGDLERACATVPLDLEKLYASTDADFAHDICGIRRHLDRETGRMNFEPRCAQSFPALT